DIVVQRQHHDPRDQDQAQLQPHGLDALRHRPANDRFDAVVKQMPTIQHRYRQQVEHAEADAEQGQEAQIHFQPVAGGFSGHLGNRNRTVDVADRNQPDHHLLDRIQHEYGVVPGILQRRPDGGQRIVVYLANSFRRQTAIQVELLHGRSDNADPSAITRIPDPGYHHQFHRHGLTLDNNLQGQFRTRPHPVHPLHPAGDRLAVDGDDALSCLQSGGFGRATGNHAVEHRRNLVLYQPQRTDRVGFDAARLPALQRDDEVAGSALAGRDGGNVQIARLTQAPQQLHGDLLPDGRLFAIHRYQLVPRTQSGIPGR